MTGLIEAAQEQLERAADKWQKTLRWRGKLDRALTKEEQELDRAITNLNTAYDETRNAGMSIRAQAEHRLFLAFKAESAAAKGNPGRPRKVRK